eukprot:1157456-Pelagomonas_calceolata.AAC.8
MARNARRAGTGMRQGWAIVGQPGKGMIFDDATIKVEVTEWQGMESHVIAWENQVREGGRRVS